MSPETLPNPEYDYIVIGSGFGGSVSALRLAEKGYKVLVIEKGKWYRQRDFARTNWQFSKWLWLPALRWFGIMKITIFKDVGIVSGTGVGGGSLVYANTLPVPKPAFFRSGSWAGLADWENVLPPYYARAKHMLGVSKNTSIYDGERAMQALAASIGKAEAVDTTEVSVYFGTPGQTVPDPYFGGEGPERAGCIFCGACMTGCRENAKNSLDKNYLYFAQRRGAQILAEKEVTSVAPLDGDRGATGYEVAYRSSTQWFSKTQHIRSRGIVFAGGVLGTVQLLLKLKKTTLPRLSDQVGKQVRTNNESLICVTQLDNASDMSAGIAIGTILATDEHSHLEICRYGSGSGAWKLSFLPFVEGPNIAARLMRMIGDVLRHPRDYWRYLWVRDWARSSLVMLFMQTLDSTLTFTRSRWGGMRTTVVGRDKPTAFIPQAIDLARRLEKIIRGKSMAFGLTPLMGIPGTAHILGGAVMGATPQEGVIDSHNCVFGYDHMMVCDGSMISANPGVNPSLSITAIAECAMDLVPDKSAT